MDELLASVHSAGPNPDRWPKQFVTHLKSLTPQQLLQPTGSGLNPLAELDAEQHSLGYAFILGAQLNADLGNPLALLPFVHAFALRLSRDQLMQVPERISIFGRGVLKLAETVGSPILAVRPLLAAAKRFAAHPGHLTPLHQLFLRACLLAKCYKKGLELLDHPITDVEPVCDTRVQDFLLYHYYGGMILEGLQQHARALDSLALVITAPSQVTSAIQIEAYKKFVLISLKEHGKIRALPKYLANCVARAVKAKATPYTELATAYESGNVARVNAEYQKHQAAFARDHNEGLAKQLIDALWKRNVAKLTQTYVTLSVEDISKQLGMDRSARRPEQPSQSQSQSSQSQAQGQTQAPSAPNLESLLLAMVEKGEIDAAVDQRQGMVEFRDPPSGYDDETTVRKLNELIDRSMAVNESIVKMDRQLGLSRDFLSKQVQADKAGGGSVAFGGVMDDEVRAL